MENDKISWKYSQVGNYIIKTAYNKITYKNDETRRGHFSNIWKIWAQPKIQTCIWHIVHHSIPTKDLLIKKGVNMQTSCSTCGETETIDHALWVFKKKSYGKGRDLSRMQIMVKPTSLDGLETEYREKVVHQTAKTLHVCGTYFVGDLVL